MRTLGRRTGAGVLAGMLTAAVLLIAAAPVLAATNITGAGATFPLPLYQKWASDYNKKVGDVQVSYTGVGSSAGIAQIEAKTVDFGGSDAPLNRGQLTGNGLVQFPTCVGGVVPIVNISGVGSGKLRLTGPVLAQVFMGTVTRWNASPIKKLNPGVKLPATPIKVVHRSDGSGTTWIFTNYLGVVSTEWRGDVGIGKTVSWPVGQGGKGNEGVASIVKVTDGAIGYVEYAYAKTNGLAWAPLQNAAGKYVKPSVKSFAAAAAATKWTWKNGFYEILVNKPGAKTWPITGATFVLIQRTQQSQSFGRTMLKFFDWALRNPGARSSAKALSYVPLPTSAVTSIENVWKSSVKGDNKPCWP